MASNRIGTTAGLALILAISGCGWFSEEEAPVASSPATAEDFPNLASVPEEAPRSTPRVEREQLLEGLRADRANAEYTAETLGVETANPPPAEPPPAAPPVPEAEVVETADDSDGSAPAEEASEPVQVAALPVDPGDPAAEIYFPDRSTALTDRDRAILRDVVLLYQQQRGSRLRVIGHASAGETAPDSDIAGVRAAVVAEALVALGVPARFLETSTGGATYDESEANGVAANRRVTVFIGS